MPDSTIPADWLAQARVDLQSARVLRSASPSLLERAVYLAAQAAEKTLKALLIKHGVPYRSFRHDIPGLLKAASAIETSLSAFAPRLANFATYSVETRYPTSPHFTVTEAQVDEAISAAEDLILTIAPHV